MKLILLGPPGAGKGTQADILADHFNIPKLSTGDMLRRVAEGEDHFSLQIKEVMARGGLISDQVMVDIVENAINNIGGDGGFILDGFPRTIEQAKILENFLKNYYTTLTAVFYIFVQPSELIRRICGRFSCKSCGRVYHKETYPPKIAGVCDGCGMREFMYRQDDNVDTVKLRLDAYERMTSPLIEYYKKSDVPFYQIDGALHLDDVNKTILHSLSMEGY